MTVKSVIVKLHHSGLAAAVFCRSELTHPSVARILLEHYAQEEQVDILIGHGDIRSLGPTPQTTLRYRQGSTPRAQPRDPQYMINNLKGLPKLDWTASYDNPQRIYTWTPDGWFGSPIGQDQEQEPLADLLTEPRG